MKYEALAQDVRTGTTENLVNRLNAFGNDKDFIVVIEAAVQNGRDVLRMYNGTGNIEKWSRTRDVTEQNEKKSILIDFHAKQGVFAPTPKAPTPDQFAELTAKFEAAVARLERLEEKLEEKAEAAEPAKEPAATKPEKAAEPERAAEKRKGPAIQFGAPK